MKENINILFCTNENYIMPTSVAITSIFENNKHHSFNIFIFHSILTNNSKTMFLELAKKYKQNINLILIEEHYFSNAPTLRWSKDMYYRLLAGEKLPLDISKILYIDSDVVFNKDIAPLYNLSFEDNLLIATETTEKAINYQIKLLNLNIKRFFPSGEILFDLTKSRKFLNYEYIHKIIEENEGKLLTPDQDILNIIFNGKIKPLPKIYNNCEITNYNDNNLHRLINHIDKKEKEDTVVFHYATSKPWNNLFSGSCEDVWLKYLKISPFNKEYKKYTSLKYKILRMSIIKVLFFYYIRLTPCISIFFRKMLNEQAYQNLRNFYRKKIK